MKIVISSGHGKLIRGASGYIDEVDEARRVVAKVAEYLAETGVKVEVFHDDVSTSQDENLKRIVDFHNGETRELDVSVHFNAYETTEDPMGCECLYVSQAALAGNIADKICAAADLKHRGAKKRTDLYFLNQTDAPAVLIEVCFVDSRADVEQYDSYFDPVCRAIAEAISGQRIAQTEPPTAPGESTPKPAPPKSETEEHLLGTLEGCEIWHITQGGKERVEWTAKMAVCCDGMPQNTYDDDYWQRGTAYYSNTTNNGYLDADEVSYIVVPPLIRSGVPGIVMGCQGAIRNTKNDENTPAICGEIGPPEKIGEASCEAARRVGLDGNPNYGGTDDHIIKYVIWPGVPATVDGVTYKLQPA